MSNENSLKKKKKKKHTHTQINQTIIYIFSLLEKMLLEIWYQLYFLHYDHF